jgi:hypothetical protein
MALAEEINERITRMEEEKIYASWEEAQSALDAGLTVRIAVEPYTFDPALLQLALGLHGKERLEAWKRNQSPPKSAEEEA